MSEQSERDRDDPRRAAFEAWAASIPIGKTFELLTDKQAAEIFNAPPTDELFAPMHNENLFKLYTSPSWSGQYFNYYVFCAWLGYKRGQEDLLAQQEAEHAKRGESLRELSRLSKEIGQEL